MTSKLEVARLHVAMLEAEEALLADKEENPLPTCETCGRPKRGAESKAVRAARPSARAARQAYRDAVATLDPQERMKENARAGRVAARANVG